MDSTTVVKKVPETRIETSSRLEWRIGVGLFIFSLLGILINLFE